jgi:hypothetical protein
MKRLLVALSGAFFVYGGYTGIVLATGAFDGHVTEHASAESRTVKGPAFFYFTSDDRCTDQELLWDNGVPDEVNGTCCARIGSVQECDTADDIHTDQDYTITGITWDTVDDQTYLWDETGDPWRYIWIPETDPKKTITYSC